MDTKGVVNKQRQKIDKLLQAFETAQLDLVRPYNLLQEEFDRQHYERRVSSVYQISVDYGMDADKSFITVRDANGHIKTVAISAVSWRSNSTKGKLLLTTTKRLAHRTIVGSDGEHSKRL